MYTCIHTCVHVEGAVRREMMAAGRDDAPDKAGAEGDLTLPLCTHLRICVYIYIHVCIYIYIYICIHTYMHTYIHTCIYIYICIKLH